MSTQTSDLANLKEKIDEPPMYRVILLNDDYTTMDFVVYILETIFHKHHDEAVKIMYHIHEKGAAECGIYTVEIAETKISLVHQKAESQGYPLKATMEKA